MMVFIYISDFLSLVHLEAFLASFPAFSCAFFFFQISLFLYFLFTSHFDWVFLLRSCAYFHFKKKKWSCSVMSILCNSIDCNLPDSSIHGIFQARILESVAIVFSRGSSGPRDQTWVSHTAGSLFTVWDTREVIFSLCKSSVHRKDKPRHRLVHGAWTFQGTWTL